MSMRSAKSLRSAAIALVCLVMACGSESGGEGGGGGGNKEGTSSNSGSAGGSGKGDLGVKAGKIEFTFSGGRTGKSTVYFDDWGATVVVMTDIKMGRMMEDRKKVIWKDGQATICDLTKDDKKVVQFKIRPRDTELGMLAGLAPDKFDAQMKMAKYERLADEAVAGKTCAVYHQKGNDVKIWRWKGIDLKSALMPKKGGFTKEATSVQELDAIPASALELPEGFSK